MINRSSIRSQMHTLVLLLVFLMQFASWTVAAAQSSANEHVAIILILDDSGSMKTSDAANLRYTAAQLFVALLDEGDAVGALHFSTTSTPITNGIEIIGGPEEQTRLAAKLVATPPNGFTDVKAAFEEAQRMRLAFNQAGYQVVVIFLTDGKPEIPQPYASYEDEALKAAREIGTPILSIALTSASRSSFLNRVANETGGRVIFANEATDLLDIYLQILGELKDRTVIGSGSVNSPGQAEIVLDPALMPYVDRVSFVVSKPASVSADLVTPDNQMVSADDPQVAFAIQDQRFSVFSMLQPAGGSWRFQLSGRGVAQARAILYSRLRARLVAPESAFEAGKPMLLVVKLIEEQLGQAPVTIIGQASFAAWITRPDGAQDSLDQFYDDGTHGDAVAGDGNYSRLYVNTDQPGIYRVRIQGYKGSVPVTYQAQLDGIAVPTLVLDQPADLHYDIRANTVPLAIHLAGAEPVELDHGDFVAVVTAPSGETLRIPLQRNGSAFSSEIVPIQNGTYQVHFEPVDAIYQGLPYLHTLDAKFEARIIPTLTVKEIQIGLQPPLIGETPHFELSQAQQGIPLIVTFSSTSPRTETITARLDGLVGFKLSEGSEFTVIANGNTTLTFHLLADPVLQPQVIQGQLSFSVADGVDLVNGNIPLTFNLFEPTLSVTPVITSTVSPESCLVWAPVRLTLYLNSTSTQSEQIQLRLENLPGVSLSQETVTVLPGASQLELTLLPANGKFSPGDYHGQLVIEEVRSGAKLIGDSTFQVAFWVEPVWVTCRKSMIISGAALAFGFIVIVTLIAKARQKARPPVVTGTLIHWSKDAPDLTTDVNLTAINKTEVKIGKGSQNDIVIVDEAMQDEHALILVERDENEELRFTLRPKASVRKGYREYNNDLPLEENVQYQMGSQMFKYIRDLDL